MVCGPVALLVKQDKQVHDPAGAQLPKGVRDDQRDTGCRNSGSSASGAPGDGQKPAAPPLRRRGAPLGHPLRRPGGTGRATVPHPGQRRLAGTFLLLRTLPQRFFPLSPMAWALTWAASALVCSRRSFTPAATAPPSIAPVRTCCSWLR